jgi:hypothetical protein
MVCQTQQHPSGLRADVADSGRWALVRHCKSLKLFEQAADLTEGTPSRELAEQDEQRPQIWYRRAAKQGEAKSQMLLALASESVCEHRGQSGAAMIPTQEKSSDNANVQRN